MGGQISIFRWALTAGVGGFFSQQVTDDYGSGRPSRRLQGSLAAVGPLLGYRSRQGPKSRLQRRWFHEFGVQNRIRGT